VQVQTYIIMQQQPCLKTLVTIPSLILNVNTTGAIIFISNNVVLSSAGTQDVNNNAIVGTFVHNSNSASGTLTLFTSAASSVSGSVTNNNNNNFRILR
jgi:hypothetical protein